MLFFGSPTAYTYMAYFVALSPSSSYFLPSPGHQIFFKHGVRLVEAAEIQLESQGGPATYAVFILPYL